MGPKSNRLIAALPAADFQQWAEQLQAIDLPYGQVLLESSRIPSHAYFPIDCVVSLLYVLENGASAEFAMVGPEGVVGIALFMGGISTPSRAVVQRAGSCLRMPAAPLLKLLATEGPAMHLFLRYTQALITQMAQSAVCNRHHSVDQQLCRWLLSSLDRLAGLEVLMTQEHIAHLLGVRREGVTEAASTLQKEGLIRYTRGRITVLDRPALEARSCECYAVVRNEYNRLLP